MMVDSAVVPAQARVLEYLAMVIVPIRYYGGYHPPYLGEMRSRLETSDEVANVTNESHSYSD